jgi:hypothetical protein
MLSYDTKVLSAVSIDSRRISLWLLPATKLTTFAKRQKLPNLYCHYHKPSSSTMSAPNRCSAVYVDPSPRATHVRSPPTVAKLAVSTAGQLNSLAKTVKPDPFRIKQALQLLHRDTSHSVRTMLHLDGAVAKQYYFLVNEAVRVISCPT